MNIGTDLSSSQHSIIQNQYFQVSSYLSFEAKDLVMSPSMSREEFLIKVNGIADEHGINLRVLVE